MDRERGWERGAGCGGLEGGGQGKLGKGWVGGGGGAEKERYRWIEFWREYCLHREPKFALGRSAR